MNSGERAFIAAKWITIIGISPILYLFFGTLLFMFIGEFINRLTDGAINTLLNEQSVVYTLVIVGYFMFLYFLVLREKKKKIKAMKQVNNKFLLGVFLIFIGHLGLGAFYTLMVYGIIHGNGSISGIFFIPMIFWMIIFYSIGFGIVDKQKLSERFHAKNELESHT